MQRPLPPGELEPDAGVAEAVISVPNFEAAVAYMRAIPAGRLEAMKVREHRMEHCGEGQRAASSAPGILPTSSWGHPENGKSLTHS